MKSSFLHSVLVILIYHVQGIISFNQVGDNTCILKYDVNTLLSLRPSATTLPLDNIPYMIHRKKTRRGTRAGVRRKMRKRANRPFMPVITFGNCRSIHPKIDELRLYCRFMYQFREASCIALTETWLDDVIPDSGIDITNFTVVRADRDSNSCKSRGGGLAAYINNSWCRDITIKKRYCQPELELLTISLRPFYLPREFSNVFITLVYIPPSGNKSAASKYV